jgi:hypothetical protein
MSCPEFILEAAMAEPRFHNAIIGLAASLTKK